MHKNKNNYLLSTLAVGLIASASLCAYAALPSHKEHRSLEALRYLDESPRELKRNVKAKTISSEGFLYEDFETVTGEEPYMLPDGWTVSATPRACNRLLACRYNINGRVGSRGN